ncbi:hypothetical protein FD723_40235 (plasmid) [Nostoc sp. C052]|uniref:hypothetical protein n=1 Tax=Nostoc sp. C052 TaxID=2576902 RepID=UPI0015C3FD72|nr:hypothetical protein [Nostoc sp. C052]QLE46443.1 hypothetical protein FD723_40235 [Nostoc sp. C052]
MNKETITTLKAIFFALEEAESKGIRDRRKIIAWALQYGKSLGVQQDRIEQILSQPLDLIFELKDILAQ